MTYIKVLNCVNRDIVIVHPTRDVNCSNKVVPSNSDYRGSSNGGNEEYGTQWIYGKDHKDGDYISIQIGSCPLVYVCTVTRDDIERDKSKVSTPILVPLQTTLNVFSGETIYSMKDRIDCIQQQKDIELIICKEIDNLKEKNPLRIITVNDEAFVSYRSPTYIGVYQQTGETVHMIELDSDYIELSIKLWNIIDNQHSLNNNNNNNNQNHYVPILDCRDSNNLVLMEDKKYYYIVSQLRQQLESYRFIIEYINTFEWIHYRCLMEQELLPDKEVNDRKSIWKLVESFKSLVYYGGLGFKFTSINQEKDIDFNCIVSQCHQDLFTRISHFTSIRPKEYSPQRFPTIKDIKKYLVDKSVIPKDHHSNDIVDNEVLNKNRKVIEFKGQGLNPEMIIIIPSNPIQSIYIKSNDHSIYKRYIDTDCTYYYKCTVPTKSFPLYNVEVGNIYSTVVNIGYVVGYSVPSIQWIYNQTKLSTNFSDITLIQEDFNNDPNQSLVWYQHNFHIHFKQYNELELELILVWCMNNNQFNNEKYKEGYISKLLRDNHNLYRLPKNYQSFYHGSEVSVFQLRSFLHKDIVSGLVSIFRTVLKAHQNGYYYGDQLSWHSVTFHFDSVTTIVQLPPPKQLKDLKQQQSFNQQKPTEKEEGYQKQKQLKKQKIQKDHSLVSRIQQFDIQSVVIMMLSYINGYDVSQEVKRDQDGFYQTQDILVYFDRHRLPSKEKLHYFGLYHLIEYFNHVLLMNVETYHQIKFEELVSNNFKTFIDIHRDNGGDNFVIYNPTIHNLTLIYKDIDGGIQQVDIDKNTTTLNTDQLPRISNRHSQLFLILIKVTDNQDYWKLYVNTNQKYHIYDYSTVSSFYRDLDNWDPEKYKQFVPITSIGSGTQGAVVKQFDKLNSRMVVFKHYTHLQNPMDTFRYNMLKQQQLHYNNNNHVNIPTIINNDEFKHERSIYDQLVGFEGYQHPNIVGYRGEYRVIGDLVPNNSSTNLEEPSKSYIVLDYAENGSLYDVIKNQPELLTFQRQDQIIKGIASGMNHSHTNRNILHRDLKLQNILIDGRFNPLITDFGNAKYHNNTIFSANNTITIRGTHGYIAPEVLTSPTSSYPSDVFSFGIVMLLVLLKKPHYHNLYGCYFDAMDLLEEFKRMSTNNNVDKDRLLKYYTLIKKCLSFDPNERPTFKDIINFKMIEYGYKEEKKDSHQYINENPDIPPDPSMMMFMCEESINGDDYIKRIRMFWNSIRTLVRTNQTNFQDIKNHLLPLTTDQFTQLISDLLYSFKSNIYIDVYNSNQNNNNIHEVSRHIQIELIDIVKREYPNEYQYLDHANYQHLWGYTIKQVILFILYELKYPNTWVLPSIQDRILSL